MFTSPVPDFVLEQYLTRYSTAQKAEIENAYFELRAEYLFFPKTRTPKLLTTAGAEGAGKSTLLKKKVAEQEKLGTHFVRLDTDDIRRKLPGYKDQVGSLHDYFSITSTFFTALRDVTNEWTMAAKYINDRLLNDCIYLGLPVAFETTAHTPKIGDFFANIKANGYAIELDLCDAPLDVKQAASKSRFERGEAYIDPAMITRKDADVIKNIQQYSKHVDTLNILWRNDGQAPLVLTATAQAKKAETRIHDQSAADAFDAAHANHAGVTVDNILAMHAHYHGTQGKAMTAKSALVIA